MIYQYCCNLPLGPMTVTANARALTGLQFGLIRDPQSCSAPDHPVIGQTVRFLERYFAGLRPDPAALPLEPAGSEFSRLVWQLLLQTPFGSTVTYGELARLTARRMNRAKMSPQAIGNAVGRNPIIIIIPCHRVIAAGGYIGGFSCGIKYKQKLLELENTEVKI